VIATFHLGDPVTPSDSWRPWRRRQDVQDGLRRLAPELADRPAWVDEPARNGEPVRPEPAPSLQGEDFIPSD